MEQKEILVIAIVIAFLLFLRTPRTSDSFSGNYRYPNMAKLCDNPCVQDAIARGYVLDRQRSATNGWWYRNPKTGDDIYVSQCFVNNNQFDCGLCYSEKHHSDIAPAKPCLLSWLA